MLLGATSRDEIELVISASSAENSQHLDHYADSLLLISTTSAYAKNSIIVSIYVSKVKHTTLILRSPELPFTSRTYVSLSDCARRKTTFSCSGNDRLTARVFYRWVLFVSSATPVIDCRVKDELANLIEIERLCHQLQQQRQQQQYAANGQLLVF